MRDQEFIALEASEYDAMLVLHMNIAPNWNPPRCGVILFSVLGGRQ
jgi:hypothetical protein